jgi:hypothetical protein
VKATDSILPTVVAGVVSRCAVIQPVFKLLAAPATNGRSPRYMERALAAIHQARDGSEHVTLLYAATEGRVGLFLHFEEDDDEFVCGPVAANYPNCSLTTIPSLDEAPAEWQIWSAELILTPDLFPILRHAQFEDLLNGTFADPINGILRGVLPAELVHCRVEIRINAAPRWRQRTAAQAVRLLEREFFRHHHRLAEFYAEHVTRSWRWGITSLLSIFARQSPYPVRTSLDTSGSRQHDREEDLQAASGKIGGHLFEARIGLVVSAPVNARRLAADRLRQVAGAFGAFTQSRLATFHLGRIRRGLPSRKGGQGSLLSHEEVATLFHPPTATAAAERMQTTDFRELEPPAQAKHRWTFVRSWIGSRS